MEIFRHFFTPETKKNLEFEEAVEEYEELDALTVNAALTRLTVVGDN